MDEVRGFTENCLYYFASSSNNNVFFAGPYRAFSGHHIAFPSPVEVETLFGHGPLSKNSRFRASLTINDDGTWTLEYKNPEKKMYYT